MNEYCTNFHIYSILCDFSNQKFLNQNLSKIFLKKYSVIKIINGNEFYVNGENSLSVKVLILVKSHSIVEKFNNFSKFFPNLINLSIIKSKLIRTKSFKLKKLQYLDLSFNPIINISIINNFSCFNLKFLNLSFTKIQIINSMSLKDCLFLLVFKINNSPIKFIIENSFKNLTLLQIFDYREIKFEKFSWKDAENLKNIKKAIGHNFYFCCLLKKFRKNSVSCNPTKSTFEACNKLIDSNITRTLCWCYAIFGIFLNVSSFYIFLSSKNFSKFFRLLLTFSDLLTIVYFLCLIIANEYYQHNYLYEKLKWKNSIFCQFLGSILTFATELSVLSTLLIAMEALFAIKFYYKQNFFSKISHKISVAVVICVSVQIFLQYLYNSVNIILKISFFFQ